MKRYKKALFTLHALYRLINSTFDLKELLLGLCRIIRQLIPSKYCAIILFDPTKEYSTLKVTLTPKRKYLTEKKTKIPQSIKNVITQAEGRKAKSNIFVIPLVSEDQIGMIILKRAIHDRAFDVVDKEILKTFAEQTVIAIRNLQLYDEQQRLVWGSIKSLVTLMDTRSGSVYVHRPIFRRLILGIAHQMHLNEEELRSLDYAGLVHDAGKLDVPKEILVKSTPLTGREFKMVKLHPIKGAQILGHIKMLKPVIPIILHHHERYDGKGYPSGLKRKRIPLGARIMAVADAFEAMVYGRPYRNKISIVGAIKEVKKNSATQFDPQVVEAFLKAIKTLKLKIS